MCRNQEILPVSASLFLRYLLFANLLRLWDTLYLAVAWSILGHNLWLIARLLADQPPQAQAA
ncbi:MAG: hypothetical protein J6386_20570 [Candidatus Synoicihabitans palmerolidicus]|nr:hypothetical protein [Candidatus Synoicihabitans palmerolidicus]